MKLTSLTPLIQVYDMREALDFYCGALGFEVISSSPEIEAPEGRYFHWARLRREDAELMLNTAYDTGERPSARDLARQAGHRDTCLYIGCDDPDAAYEALAAKGLEIDAPTTALYGMRQLYLRDPDGYQVCLQAEV